jgi:hypothetical protein
MLMPIQLTASIILGQGVTTIFLLAVVFWRIQKMSTELDRVATEVGETNTLIDSAITLLGNLSQMIRDAGTDPAKLTELADSLDAEQNKLAAAIVANTPAAPGEDTPAAG